MPTKISEQSLVTAAAELKYEKSIHSVEIISKNEDFRRLQFGLNVLRDDNDELRGLLDQETERSNTFERLVNEHLARAEEAETRMHNLRNELCVREQELSTLEAEKAGLQNITQDASAAVSEKLALARELSILKPELEHLRTQAQSTEALMTDKLALQRQLAEMQLELENAKREVKRALAKRRNTGVEIAQEEQMDELRRQLAKEKRARQRAEDAMETANGDLDIERVRKELSKEKRARQKIEEKLEEALNSTQIEEVRNDLLREKKAKDRLQQTIDELRAEIVADKKYESHIASTTIISDQQVKDLEQQIDSLQKELASEKKKASKLSKKNESNHDDDNNELKEKLALESKERARLEKLLQGALAESEIQKSTLEDKLDQFRSKLRSTKEKLKSTEIELVKMQEAITAPPPPSRGRSSIAKSSHKRRVGQMDADETTLGTPGNGHTAKRGRKVLVPTVGDKSTFSITPFLNRTTSIAPESDEEDDQIASPSIQQKRPLNERSASERNVPKRKPADAPAAKNKLEAVTEDHEDTKERERAKSPVELNTAKLVEAAAKVLTKTSDGPSKPTSKKPKLRKSIHDFVTFTAEPEVKRRRKLGGVGKTLFDDDDGDDDGSLPVKAAPPRGLFGGRGLGLSGKKGGLLGPRLAVNESGAAAFSPLKRSRKNIDDTLRG